MKDIKFDSDKAEKLYVKEGYSLSQTAKECGVSVGFIAKYMELKGLKRDTTVKSAKSTRDNAQSRKPVGGKTMSHKISGVDLGNAMVKEGHKAPLVDNSEVSNMVSNMDSITTLEQAYDDILDREIAKAKADKTNVNKAPLSEKIAYANRKYGTGNWVFLDREEFVDAMSVLQAVNH